MGAIALLLVLFVTAFALIPPTRHVIVRIVAALALTAAVSVVVVVFMALRELREWNAAMARIAATEVELTDLDLSGTSDKTYKLRGFVHNRSTRYTLTDAKFELTVEDCVAGHCREQARGRGEVIRRVRPGETVGFSTEAVILPSIAAPAGERRLSYRVQNTWGVP